MNSGCIASLKAIAFPAIAFSCGPPWRPGNTALSMAFANFSLQRIIAPLGPRSVLCVVVIITSKYGTGDCNAPPAMSPAVCEMSATVIAPTSSAISLNFFHSISRGYAVYPATIIFGLFSNAIFRTFSISIRPVSIFTSYWTKLYARPENAIGRPCVMCPPCSSFSPITVSPNSNNAKYIAVLAGDPEYGWTFACSAPKSSFALFIACVSMVSMFSCPP